MRKISHTSLAHTYIYSKQLRGTLQFKVLAEFNYFISKKSFITCNCDVKAVLVDNDNEIVVITA